MKKVFCFVLAVLLVVCLFAMMSVTAFAADEDVGETVTADTNEFVNWDVLATYAGCLTLTMFITQMLKSRWPITWPTQLLSYIIALIILICANWALGTLTLNSAGLCIFNAVLITLAANGGYNNFNDTKAAASVKVKASGPLITPLSAETPSDAVEAINKDLTDGT